MAATAFSNFSIAERVVLSWAGLRGAVPVVLATFPVIEGVPQSLEYFNIVFFAVLLSTLVQGSTFEPLANWLGVTTEDPALEHEAPRRPSSATAVVSSARAWTDADGDPAYPREVAGRRVLRQLRTRLDQPGALVELDDGRYAFTGSVLALGSATALQAAARRRLERAATGAEREWWREVIGELAH
jgi:hypothetical protein